VIDFKNYDDVNHYDRIISSVKQILSLKISDPKADTSALDAEIDRMVYKLYDLTEEEIKIVEGEIE
jgi:type II restriction/modification system DNA methylase subunit YeeA